MLPLATRPRLYRLSGAFAVWRVGARAVLFRLYTLAATRPKRHTFASAGVADGTGTQSKGINRIEVREGAGALEGVAGVVSMEHPLEKRSHRPFVTKQSKLGILGAVEGGLTRTGRPATSFTII